MCPSNGRITAILNRCGAYPSDNLKASSDRKLILHSEVALLASNPSNTPEDVSTQRKNGPTQCAGPVILATETEIASEEASYGSENTVRLPPRFV